MAVGSTHTKQFALWYGNHPHPMLDSHFNQEEVEALFEEDLSAGKSIPLILTAVIFGGTLLGVISVLLCW